MIKAESRTGSLPMLGTPPSSQLPPILRTGANAGAFLMTAKAVLMWASILVQAVLFQATICGNLRCSEADVHGKDREVHAFT
eukprot:1145100-Pelagomonas_calceolata.AAC.2